MIHHQDILVDILSWLPAKAIGRCRCVSKPWRNLLSQPHFIKTHLNRTKQSPFAEQSLILHTYQSKSLFTLQLKNAFLLYNELNAFATHLNFDDHQFNSQPIIYGTNFSSCDGLTLFQDDEMLLANLTIKEVKELPASPNVLARRGTYIVSGVGYDPESDDYKVVTVYFYHKGSSYSGDIIVDVYSVKKGAWKKVADFPYNYTIYYCTPGVFVNGHIHWTASKTFLYTSAIVAFDLSQEKFCEFPPPASLFEGPEYECNHLLTLEGCLSLFGMRIGFRSDVWMMKEYGVKESWIKIMIIDPEKSHYLRPLCLLSKEELLLVRNEMRKEKKLLLYNLKEGRLKDIVVQGIPEDFRVNEINFMESLVSPHCSIEYV